MAYSTLTDLQKSMPAKKITELCNPEDEADVVADLIDQADGEMDLYTITSWGSAAKMACSLAITKRALYSRHGTGKIPGEVSKEAEHWRALLSLRQGIAERVAFDPTLDETDDELAVVLDGED